jgi:hypothetical protein
LKAVRHLCLNKLYGTGYFRDHEFLQLTYENHRILLGSFDRAQTDEIQRRTNNEMNVKSIQKKEKHTLLFTSSNDNISDLKKTTKIMMFFHTNKQTIEVSMLSYLFCFIIGKEKIQ